jgi:hypothetical protein
VLVALVMLGLAFPTVLVAIVESYEGPPATPTTTLSACWEGTARYEGKMAGGSQWNGFFTGRPSAGPTVLRRGVRAVGRASRPADGSVATVPRRLPARKEQQHLGPDATQP